ncbi:MAG: gliding motility-associated C-terminal domain-containing protein, partial [Crocinitomicaceae bacterium]|nr:gliding motility-associated C-terminal domain-containing protein [Crocinitomicaceae bacterium]
PSGGKGDTTGVGAPYGIAVDGAGNVYWTERTGYCIRKWSPIDSIVTTVAGTPLVSGTEITDINALTTPITVRGGIDVSLDGNRIYYASFDTYNVNEIYFDGSIRKIRTIAGTGVLGSGDLVGLGTTIALGTPFGVKIAPDGSVFFCEQTAGLVRRVDLTTGLISTIAGVQDNIVYNDNLLDPLLTTMGPLDVAFGEGDNIIISDNENHLIRRKFTCFNPDPTEIVISPDEYCVGDSITLKVVGNLNDGEEWYWLEGNCDIFAPVLDSGVVYETVAKPDISEYYAKGIGECTINEPCAGITIETSCLPYSNVFTPNGDGINEFFDLEIAKDYPSNYLYVYNRYGDEVFFTQDYDNEMVVWDGSSDATGGVVVPGTYYFVLYDLSSNTDVLSGWVEVIK